jgi:hypothetical protein
VAGLQSNHIRMVFAKLMCPRMHESTSLISCPAPALVAADGYGQISVSYLRFLLLVKTRPILRFCIN